MYGLHAFNKDTAIMMGGRGSLMKTEDGGSSWDTAHCIDGVQGRFEDVHFADPSTGYAVTRSGKFYSTQDGGDTWQLNANLNVLHLYSVHFVDPDTGYAVGSGGSIFWTTDSGNNWTPQMSGTSKPLYSVDFLNDSIGCAVGNDRTIVRTTDGGNNWDSISSGTSHKFNSVRFGPDSVVVAGGEGGIFMRSEDRGDTWDSIGNGPFHIKSLELPSDSVVLAVGRMGYNGKIHRSTDTGSTWSQQTPSGKYPWLSSVRFIDASTGWVTGKGGVALQTQDGGQNWNELGSSDPYSHLTDLQFIGKKGWAVGFNGSIFHSDDGGVTWSRQDSGSMLMKGVHFIDTNEGWAVGASLSSGGNGTILHTTDGGNNWNVQSSGPEGTDAHFINSSEGWITTSSVFSGKVSHTSDGGNSWNNQASSNTLNDIEFLDSTEGWAVGGHWTILHTTDGGSSWQDLSQIGMTSTHRTVEAIDQDTVWVGGDGLLYTVDGGLSWNEHPKDFKAPVLSISFQSERLGWVTTRNGVLYRTMDGGESWTVDTKITDNPIHDLEMIDTTAAVIVGENGSILRRTCSNTSPFMEVDACESYESPGGKVWTSSGTYQDTVLNQRGCKKFLTIQLDIFRPDTAVNVHGDSLIVEDTTNSYHWVDCDDGMSLISGANDPSFVPSEAGNYAVTVFNGPCNETSSCYQVEPVGIEEREKRARFMIAPNPNDGNFRVQYEIPAEEGRLTLYNMKGMQVLDRPLEGRKGELLIEQEEAPSGLYLMRISSEGKVLKRKKVVVD